MVAGALTLQDVNIFVTTDVHSFVASHFHNDGLCGTQRCDADFGTLNSFIDRLRSAADRSHKDIFLFDNGDVVDGTGLSAATEVDGGPVFPLLSALPLSALNCGNHELYQSTTVLRGLRGKGSSGHGAQSFVDRWNGTYLTSNIDLSSTGAALGSRYTMLHGKHGTRLLVMGWLYEMPDHCAAVGVTNISAAVREPWFEEAMALAPSVDAIVVLAHMDYANPLVKTLLAAIRSRVGPSVPVQFLTGHSHVRAFARLDEHASSFEAGHYGDTLGFVTFGVGEPKRTQFDFEYLPMRRTELIRAAGASASSFDTPRGLELSERIRSARAAYNLSRVLGCSPRHYNVSAPLDDAASLWALYMHEVAPRHVFVPAHNTSQWFISSTGALRYDVYKGPVTVDDVDMALPFSDSLHVARHVRGATLAKALRLLRSGARLTAAHAQQQVQQQVQQWRQDDAEERYGGRGARPRFLTPPDIAGGIPLYLATSDNPPADQYFDAIVGRFDTAAVAAAIQQASGSAQPIALVPYDEHVVAPGGSPPPANDTAAWMRWASSLPPQPC